MLTGSDGTTYEPLHFTFFFALSCKVTLARCHRHLLVSKALKPSSIKIGVGGLDARLHQMAGEGARRRTDLEPIVSKLTFTGSTEAGKLPMEPDCLMGNPPCSAGESVLVRESEGHRPKPRGFGAP